jgi:hypothetical protein
MTAALVEVSESGQELHWERGCLRSARGAGRRTFSSRLDISLMASVSILSRMSASCGGTGAYIG